MSGKEIKELRKKLKFTQAQLAAEVGVTPNTIARYERSELKPSAPVLKLLQLTKLLVPGGKRRAA